VPELHTASLNIELTHILKIEIINQEFEVDNPDKSQPSL
jgi:hypothetical protein